MMSLSPMTPVPACMVRGPVRQSCRLTHARARAPGRSGRYRMTREKLQRLLEPGSLARFGLGHPHPHPPWAWPVKGGASFL